MSRFSCSYTGQNQYQNLLYLSDKEEHRLSKAISNKLVQFSFKQFATESFLANLIYLEKPIGLNLQETICFVPTADPFAKANVDTAHKIRSRNRLHNVDKN